MKLYTFYTESHSIFLNDWFMPSFTSTNNDVELVVTKFEQKCKSGNYMSDGWFETMYDKIDLVIRGIEENWNDYFIHSDCDIQFFGEIKNDLLNQVNGMDLAGINEDPFNPNSETCCGFFICKGNDRTLSLFKEVKNVMRDKKTHDQHAFNYIKNSFITNKQLNYKYYNVAHSNGGKLWTPGIHLNNFKKDILVHHANWIIGVDHKTQNLKLVKDMINA